MKSTSEIQRNIIAAQLLKIKRKSFAAKHAGRTPEICRNALRQ
jgi:hypothetical protein